jgi:Stigma-specific protein, Stig1
MVNARARLAPFLSCLLLALGCGQDTNPLTQLVLVADTDIQALDQVVFEISSEARGSRTAQASRVGQSAPSYVSVVHEEGPLGPVTVSARGLHQGVELVQRTQLVYFVAGQTRVVPLSLLASCQTVVCPLQQTCSASGCISQDLPAEALSAWNGEPPRLGAVAPGDAGLSDAGAADAAVPELDAGAESDASIDAGMGRTHRDASLPNDAASMASDAAVSHDASSDAQLETDASFAQCSDGGPLVDLASDSANCGMCANKCANGTKICMAGACVKK